MLVREASAVFLDEIKTGLTYVQETEKTGYFIYVPSTFKKEKKWPLVIGLSEWHSSTKTYMEKWISEAEKRGLVVLCPDWWKSRDALPDQGDSWLLKILRKVSEQYSIDKSKILITGFADGGDYAYYLALRYPKRFSAAAPIGGALAQSYDNLIFYGKIKRHPLPFFVLNGKNDKGLESRLMSFEDVRRSVQRLRDHQLDVQYQEIDDLGHEYRSDFNSSILNWFESKFRG